MVVLVGAARSAPRGRTRSPIAVVRRLLLLLARSQGRTTAAARRRRRHSKAADRGMYATNQFTLQVANRQHLARVLRALRLIPEVVRITRVKD